MDHTDDTIRKSTDDIENDIKDTVDEGVHRGKAGMERVKRNIEHDDMTATEKLGSHVKEVGNRTAADIDKAKREMRHEK